MSRYACCQSGAGSGNCTCSKIESPVGSFLKILGVVMVVEGIPWFLSPRGAKSTLQYLSGLPDRTLRTLGLVLMALGLLAVYAATG